MYSKLDETRFLYEEKQRQLIVNTKGLQDDYVSFVDEAAAQSCEVWGSPVLPTP